MKTITLKTGKMSTNQGINNRVPEQVPAMKLRTKDLFELMDALHKFRNVFKVEELTEEQQVFYKNILFALDSEESTLMDISIMFSKFWYTVKAGTAMYFETLKLRNIFVSISITMNSN